MTGLITKKVRNTVDGRYVEYWWDKELVTVVMETDEKGREGIVDRILSNLKFSVHET